MFFFIVRLSLSLSLSVDLQSDRSVVSWFYFILFHSFFFLQPPLISLFDTCTLSMDGGYCCCCCCGMVFFLFSFLHRLTMYKLGEYSCFILYLYSIPERNKSLVFLLTFRRAARFHFCLESKFYLLSTLPFQMTTRWDIIL